MAELKLPAFAKINLWLDITGRRTDGFHTLNTVMQSVSLCDFVTITENSSGEISLSCDDDTLSNDDNLAFRAAKAFQAAFGKALSVHIHVQKHIPSQAGLGGGSADAAAVLNGLNRLCGFPFKAEALCKIGVSLGADVPFCIVGGTAKCTGIGEITSPLPPLPKTAILVVKPKISFSTAAAFRKYDENPVAEKSGFDEFCETVSAGKIPPLYNIFTVLHGETVIFELINRLASQDAASAGMSGSGSAVFGIFADEKSAVSAEKAFSDCFTATCFTTEKDKIISGIFL